MSSKSAQLVNFLSAQGYNATNEQIKEIMSILTKKPKDKDAPKAPLTSYFLYANTRREEWKAAHPQDSITQIAAGIANCWKTESDEVKEYFKNIANEKRKAYDEEMKQYNEGKKSSEPTSSNVVVVETTPTVKKVKADVDPSNQPEAKKKKANSSKQPAVADTTKESVVSTPSDVVVPLKPSEPSVVVPSVEPSVVPKKKKSKENSTKGATEGVKETTKVGASVSA